MQGPINSSAADDRGSGVWPLFRFDPRRVRDGQPPLVLDSGPAKISAKDYMRNETRFRMVEKLDPARFKRLSKLAEKQAQQRLGIYQQLANLTVPHIPDEKTEGEPALAKK